MIKTELGNLERVQLRDIWENEATDFTPWLVQHIHVLGDALDMDLQRLQKRIVWADKTA